MFLFLQCSVNYIWILAVKYYNQFDYTGFMQVDIHPCTSKGKALSEDEFVDKPEQLVRSPWIKLKC